MKKCEKKGKEREKDRKRPEGARGRKIKNEVKNERKRRRRREEEGVEEGREWRKRGKNVFVAQLQFKQHGMSDTVQPVLVAQLCHVATAFPCLKSKI